MAEIIYILFVIIAVFLGIVVFTDIAVEFIGIFLPSETLKQRPKNNKIREDNKMIKTIDIKDLVRNACELENSLRKIKSLCEILINNGEEDDIDEKYLYTPDDFDWFTFNVDRLQEIIGEDQPYFLDMNPCDAVNLYYERVDVIKYCDVMAENAQDIRDIHEMATNIQKVYDEHYPGAIISCMCSEDIITLYYSAVKQHLEQRVNAIYGRSYWGETLSDNIYTLLYTHLKVVNSPEHMCQYIKMMEELMSLMGATSISDITTKTGRKNLKVSKDYLACFIRVLTRIAREVNVMVSNYHEAYIVVLPLADYRPHKQLHSIADAYDAFIKMGPINNPNLFQDGLYKRLFDALLYLYASTCKHGDSEVELTKDRWEYIVNTYINVDDRHERIMDELETAINEFGNTLKDAVQNDTVDEENDMVNSPKHYTFAGYECLDIMEAIYGKEALMNFCKLNAFKYLWRSEHKNGLEDIEKAHFYLNRYITVAKK